MPGPHLRSVGSHAPASEGQSMYINYFMLFYMGHLSCFSHLFVQPFIYISKDSTVSYFGFCITYFVAQMVLALAPGSTFSRLLCPFDVIVG